MNATYFAVPIMLGGVERNLVFNMKVSREIKKLTGKSMLNGENPFEELTEDRIAQILAEFLRTETKDINPEDVLEWVTPWNVPDIMAAILKAARGPEAKTEDPTKETASPSAN